MIHPAKLPIEELLKACSVKRTRGSGPGGQHRNKVETAIVITHQPTGAVGQASEKRSQNRNRVTAIERLRTNLALKIRTPADSVQVKPSELWRSRIKSKKIQVNVDHTDFPALLAEALDAAAVKNYDVAAAARLLEISTSQLVKFFKSFGPAIEMINQERGKQGMKRLS